MKISTLLYLLCSFALFGQKTNFLPIEKPIIDSSLSFNTLYNNTLSFEFPVYIINDQNVIFQKDGKTRKILSTDVKSFQRSKAYDSAIFALDKTGIFINGDYVKTDTTGFANYGKTPTGEWLWKNNKSVYKNTTELKYINSSKFERLKESNGYSYHGHFKDDKNIYYYDKIVKGSDVSSAVALDSESFFDKNYYYVAGKKKDFEGAPLKYVNAVVKKTDHIAVDNNNKIQTMDAKSLVGLSRNYSVDKNHVYYRNEILPIDKKDFKNLKTWDHTNSSYISDGHKLFIGASEFKGFDVASFGMYEIADVFYDKNGVYKSSWNPKTQKSYYKKFPFKYDDPVNSNNSSISKNSDLYVFYKNQAYEESRDILYENLTEKEVNLAREQKIRLANVNGKVESVLSYDYLLSNSENKVYWNDSETDADAKTFERIPGFYTIYRDKNYVYSYSREKGLLPIEGIDVQSAKQKYGFLADKNYLYSHNYQIIKNENLELSAIFKGYSPGCGLDRTPSSTGYLFKNSDGYWIVIISNTVKIKNIGNSLPENLKQILSN